MGALLRAALALTLLRPAFLLTQELRDPPPADAAPSLNLAFDPWGMNLTWACGPNTSSVRCGMETRRRPVTQTLREHQCHCVFPHAVLHGGANFTVTADVGATRVTERLEYSNPGGKGTAAHNVSCLVYQADLMNCTWAKGPAAPENVQYFLHLRDLGSSGRTRSCPHYLGDPRATHTGCHLGGASGFGPQVYVLVNGSSPDAGVQFFDATLMLKRIEIYDPPDNITVECNASHCLVHWDTPRIRAFLSNSEMQYQLDVHRQNSMQPSDHQLVDISGGSGNSHVFQKPLPRAKHMVRMRAADSRLLQWGPWSRPVEFGSGEWVSRQLLFFSVVVLGTLVCVLVSLYLFNRFIGVSIPRIKDKVNNTDDEVLWEKSTLEAGKGDHEDIVHVEEVEEATATV